MYKKLCKYEFKSIARTLLPIYLAVLAVSLISAVSMGLSYMQAGKTAAGISALQKLFGLTQIVSMFAYFGVMVALFVVTTVVILQRFYKGLLCDEGYLMFTLPVKPWQLIASKGTAAFVMGIASGVTACLSIVILICGSVGPVQFFSSLFDPQLWKQIAQGLSEVFPKWGLHIVLYGVEGILLAIVGGLSALFQMYLSMALGHLANKHRVLMSVVAYIVISMAFSFLSGGMVIFADATGLDYVLASMTDWIPASVSVHALLWTLLLSQAVKLAVFFFGTERILSKKLNLE